MKRIKEIFIIGTCLLMWVLFVGAWTDTLKTNTPAYDDDPREADDRIRELKAAFVERLDIDHYFEASATSTYDHADTGKHRYVTFREPNDLTTMLADESAIFSKDVSSVTELHWIDESDNVLQLTSAGTLNIVSADLVGTLANNTYFTAVDAAGTGTADLIKADANDDAVLPDGAELATNTAPTTDQAIANKKYIDDQVDTKNFGSWTNLDSGSNTLVKTEVYQAGSDGFVCVNATGIGVYVRGRTDSTNGTTTRVYNYSDATTAYAGFTMPVKEDDYWSVVVNVGTPTIYWLPIGSGECVKQ